MNSSRIPATKISTSTSSKDCRDLFISDTSPAAQTAGLFFLPPNLNALPRSAFFSIATGDSSQRAQPVLLNSSQELFFTASSASSKVRTQDKGNRKVPLQQKSKSAQEVTTLNGLHRTIFFFRPAAFSSRGWQQEQRPRLTQAASLEL